MPASSGTQRPPGFVIAAYALGQSISTVELTDTGGEFRPFARESWEPVTVEGKQAFRDAVLRSIGPGNLEEMLPTMISLVSGLAAQRRLVGDAFDEYGDSDIEQARSIARAVTGSPAESSELLAHAQEQAGQIMTAVGIRSKRWRRNCSCIGGSMLPRSWRSSSGQRPNGWSTVTSDAAVSPGHRRILIRIAVLPCSSGGQMGTLRDQPESARGFRFIS
jgi:hypothetical protein